jgi:hypothetical protein
MYGFNHYGFSGGIGHSYINTATLSLSTRFDRSTELSLYGGAARVSSSFEELVPINPAFLAILCPSGIVQSCNLPSSLVINNNVFWAPDFGIRLSRSFYRGVAYLTAGESINPGNGLFLTSRAERAAVGYGYSGLRKWSINIGAYYVRALSVGNVQGGYGQITGSFNLSHEIVRHLSFVAGFNATEYRSGSFSAYNRLIYTASVGLGYSSKNIPVRFF